MKLITVGQLARRAKISRSALLHYEQEGLLHPASRTPAGYRLYSPKEVERLQLIRAYREAGLSLATIAEIIAGTGGGAARHLERRFLELNEEIAVRREQQRQLARLLGQPAMLKRGRSLDKEQWVSLLRQTGLDDGDMARWHAVFESEAPEAHRDFLESLGIPKDEVARIRAWSREHLDQCANAAESGELCTP